ncbi:MAG: cytidine deaminase [Bdellovibrionaceae bacterium]|nr:cytidine deaminase [Bdellovibrionales bacterium]MCB9083555.1 cytidine deaminase [Pseudobdellovibrionaceae bacterium]
MAETLDTNTKAKMLQAAMEARLNSHSPYSGFKVGASVLMDNGQIYGGCNVENASYGGTVCAERTAIWKGVSEGAKRVQALVVVTDSDQPWPPCGMCRQVVSEFSSPEVPVILANLKGKEIAQTVAELCPHFFGPMHLK